MKHFTNFKCLSLLLAFFAISGFAFGEKFTGLTGFPSDGTTSTVNMFDGATAGNFWQTTDNTDGASIVVDLGSVQSVSAIKIYWEAANAKAYTLSFSNDNVSFTGELSYTNMAAGNRIDAISGLTIDCRYIKMQGVARQLPYGYAIYEFEAFSPAVAALTSLKVTPSSASVKLGSSQSFDAAGLDQIGESFALSATTIWSVEGVGASIDGDGLFSSTTKGVFTVTALNNGITKTATIEVLPVNDNLSIGATAFALSGNAALAIDNSINSRWESEAGVDPQWILVKFASTKAISDIVISWEGANAKDYTIESSVDSIVWTPVITQVNMPAGARIDRLYNLAFDAKFIRITGTARNLTYGYSIWELQIFGTAPVSTSILPVGTASQISIYPNPSTENVTISGVEVGVSVAIYNIGGQIVKNAVSCSETITLNLSDLSAGNYIIQLISANGEVVSKKIAKK